MNTTTIITRAQYANSLPRPGESDAEFEVRRRAEHRAYYAQFVGREARAYVARAIGAERLRASTDPSLNDIPLPEWDRLARFLPLALSFRAAGDFASPGGLVCAAKEAARQWIEQDKAAS